ncbi:hypothetical protein [Burkholderia lata]|uniref:Intradiol ring-cleavage dioxygenase n=1 Tax=Burkholderia lata (strain ATCC 17760 / DSM 23089 / LMG 22485 / NCIMB 9086 / R18194 / 383) TaxID=482957 RepID=A0A6P2YEP0_BURL3|nr:hypothetical protein [Burkholderia lata]VWD18296.1 intradiol ring-cleavage dioxygenase [Burkholderia lata]
MSHDHHDCDARLTEQVVASFDGTPGSRPHALMRRFVRHLHVFVLSRS